MLLQANTYVDTAAQALETGSQDQTKLVLLLIGVAFVLTILISIMARGTKSGKPSPGEKSHSPYSSQVRGSETNTPSSQKEDKAPDSSTSPKEPTASYTDDTNGGEETQDDNITNQEPSKQPEAEGTSEPEPPPPVTQEPEEQSQPKYIGYDPINVFAQTEPFNYPYVIMPNPGSVIKFPRKGRRGRKGYKEDDFLLELRPHFNTTFQIFDDRFITVKGSSSPYEPDITLTDEKEGINIFLDIEIDEPYEGINNIQNRKPTHYQKVDTNRNNAFKNRGWVVIRFAEIQVHQQPRSCCRFIADVIRSIYSAYDYPVTLADVPDIKPVKQWTKERAQQWSLEKYREKYLGIDSFGHVPETEQLVNPEETELGEQIEAEVVEEPPMVYEEATRVAPVLSVSDLLRTAISESKFLAFEVDGSHTITKPASISGNTLIAHCYVKNREREFTISNLRNPTIKAHPFTFEESGPDIGLDSVKAIVNTAIQYGKYIRMRYTRSAWTVRHTDFETGEIIDEVVTESEESIRTISDVHRAIDVLDEDHIISYNLDENHIRAYCHRREAERTFRFDRISELAILDI